uniref:Uncharacterized protein n=1 Tax=Photinus pyralis TaxID=7054 RepID=A0A1Y1K9P3_PHOPY
MILTDFKIDSKINAKQDNWRPSNEKDNHRQGTGRGDESVKTTSDSKKSDSSDKLERIEGDLRGLIYDLGLTDSEALKNGKRAIKRDTNIEDEDLEEGPNNIQIVKATHDSERKKRAAFSATSANQEPRSTEQNVDERKATTVSYQSVEEANVRNRRHESVDLNKSPVVYSENALSKLEKREGTETTMEKQFEKNIQRIHAIKDEMKGGIASLQTKTLDNTQRSKHKTSDSLQEVESKEVDPLEHNVRTKRDAFGDESAFTAKIKSGKESEDENTGTRDTMTTVTSSNPRQTGAPQTLGMALLSNGVSEPTHTESLAYDATTRKPSRKRREINGRNVANIIHTRKKRAEALIPYGNVAYLPYRAEDEEIDEEGDEYQDDGFDDRSVSFGHLGRYSLDYPSHLKYEESYGTNGRPIRKYFNPDVYEHARSILQDASPYIRRKRHNFAALHSGGLTRHRLAERQFREEASKKGIVQPTEGATREQQRITDLSDTDLFRALPQSYEGELSRFKRVKRKTAFPKGEG